MAVDPNIIATLFGEDIMRSDSLRQSSGDVSETGEALEGPGGPFDDEILALIEDEQGNQEPARLSPGEFVFKQPATAYLGDGDPELGAMYLDLLQNTPEALDEVKSILGKYVK